MSNVLIQIWLRNLAIFFHTSQHPKLQKLRYTKNAETTEIGHKKGQHQIDMLWKDAENVMHVIEMLFSNSNFYQIRTIKKSLKNSIVQNNYEQKYGSKYVIYDSP